MTANMTARRIEAPFDSDEYPKSVFIQGDDLDLSYCDQCLRRADDWPGRVGIGVPGAMYQAALYCSECMPKSYSEYDGKRVWTDSGMPDDLRID